MLPRPTFHIGSRWCADRYVRKLRCSETLRPGLLKRSWRQAARETSTSEGLFPVRRSEKSERNAAYESLQQLRSVQGARCCIRIRIRLAATESKQIDQRILPIFQSLRFQQCLFLRWVKRQRDCQKIHQFQIREALRLLWLNLHAVSLTI